MTKKPIGNRTNRTRRRAMVGKPKRPKQPQTDQIADRKNPRVESVRFIKQTTALVKLSTDGNANLLVSSTEEKTGNRRGEMLIGPGKDPKTWTISTSAERFGVENPVSIGGGLAVNTTSNQLTVGDQETTTDKLTVKGEATASELTVNGSFVANSKSGTNTLSVTDDATTTNTLTVGGSATARDFTVSDTATTNYLTVNHGVTTNALKVNGVDFTTVPDASLQLNVYDIYMGKTARRSDVGLALSDTKDGLYLNWAKNWPKVAIKGAFAANDGSKTNKLAVNDEATTTDKLTVSGSATASKLTVNGSFAANDSSKTNKLSVTDESTTTNKLTVSGATETNTLKVNGDSTTSTLTVSGATNTNTLAVSGKTETKTLKVDGIEIKGNGNGKDLWLTVRDLWIGGTGSDRKPVGKYGRALVDGNNSDLVINFENDWPNGVRVASDLKVDERLWVKAYDKNKNPVYKYVTCETDQPNWSQAYLYPPPRTAMRD